MKNLLLAFAFIGFMVTSYATTTTSISTVMIECDDKCDKKDCKHDKKSACTKKDAKKACCSKDAKKDEKKACCSKDAKKSCHKKGTEKK